MRMTNPLNRELATTPTIVPASFSPAPETYERQVGQELRARQAQLGQGYTLKQVDYLKMQQHRSPYKRDAAWQGVSEEEIAHALKVANTARTLMLQDGPVWAGSLGEDELQNALPGVWNGDVGRAGGKAPEAGEATPVQVIFRPTIPADAPRSEVEAPKQLSLGQILAKIEAGKK